MSRNNTMSIDLDDFIDDESYKEFEESGTSHHEYHIDRPLSNEELSDLMNILGHDNPEAYGTYIKISYIDENGVERWIQTHVIDYEDIDYAISEAMDLANRYGISGTGFAIGYIAQT
jgi:hypothetical protein